MITKILRLMKHAEKPFACPNCGQSFYTKWYKLFGKLNGIGGTKLKCPHCGKKDYCHRPYDIK